MFIFRPPPAQLPSPRSLWFIDSFPWMKRKNGSAAQWYFSGERGREWREKGEKATNKTRQWASSPIWINLLAATALCRCAIHWMLNEKCLFKSPHWNEFPNFQFWLTAPERVYIRCNSSNFVNALELKFLLLFFGCAVSSAMCDTRKIGAARCSFFFIQWIEQATAVWQQTPDQESKSRAEFFGFEIYTHSLSLGVYCSSKKFPFGKRKSWRRRDHDNYLKSIEIGNWKTWKMKSSAKKFVEGRNNARIKRIEKRVLFRSSQPGPRFFPLYWYY